MVRPLQNWETLPPRRLAFGLCTSERSLLSAESSPGCLSVLSSRSWEAEVLTHEARVCSFGRNAIVTGEGAAQQRHSPAGLLILRAL